MGWVVNALVALHPRKTRTHCLGGWVASRASMDGYEISLPLGFDPRTVQSVASRHTHCSIPANSFCL
jgi:hypothetical protein